MKSVFGATVMLLVAGANVWAVQDPRDPGLQDSVIVGETYVDSGGTFAFVPIYAVTDDSVAFYNLPIRWSAPEGGVYAAARTHYFYPLNQWANVFDSVLLDENYIRQVGWYDFYPDTVTRTPLYTGGDRFHIMSLRFIIDPNSPPQLIRLDTCWDERNFSMTFGLVGGLVEFCPAFSNGWIGIFTGADDELMPAEFSLSQNYPNPFNPETNIEFSLKDAGRTSLIIYDLLGREVRSLIDKSLEPGYHSVTWDGRNNFGDKAPSGNYFYRLSSSGLAETRKMLLLR